MKIKLEIVNCKRCGKKITTAKKSFYGLNNLKRKYGMICINCVTEEEKKEIENAIKKELERQINIKFK